MLPIRLASRTATRGLRTLRFFSSIQGVPRVSVEASEARPQEKPSQPFSNLDDLIRRDKDVQTATSESAEHESRLKLAFEEMGGFRGVSEHTLKPEQAAILMAPLDLADIEIKPDGLLYLPEIKYRRILNKAFLPGGWGLVPRGRHTFHARVLSCDYALYVSGKFVSVARGENEVFDESQLVTSMEAVKSNALVRCCKDLGIASELWDPKFVAGFKESNCETVKVRHVVRNMRAIVWRLKGSRHLQYPYELLSDEPNNNTGFAANGKKR